MLRTYVMCVMSVTHLRTMHVTRTASSNTYRRVSIHFTDTNRQPRFTWATSLQNQQNDMYAQQDSDQPGHPPSLIRVFTVHI